MVSAGVTLASVTTGWISFALTILTWLGVYISLLKTFRSAPRAIPISLGNLRQEIQSERSMLRQRLKEGDRYHVFHGRQMKSVGTAKSHIKLVDETLRITWKEFRDLEKRFIVKNGAGGDVEDADAKTEESDFEERVSVNGNYGKYYEKDLARTSRARGGAEGGRSRRLARKDSHIQSALGLNRAGLSIDGQTYYNTNISHRFKWWWLQSDVQDLSNRVQRIQLRRIQHDEWESNQLVKRGLTILGAMSGEDPYFDCGEGKGPQGGGGGGAGGVKRRRSHKSAKSSRAGSRRMSMNFGGNGNGNGSQRSRNVSRSGDAVREIYEKEIRRVKRKSDSEGSATSRSSSRAPPPPVSPKPAKVAGSTVSMSRRADSVRRSRAPSVVEYEVVNPGRMWVDVEPSSSGRRGSTRNQRPGRPQPVHETSYVRERTSTGRMRED